MSEGADEISAQGYPIAVAMYGLGPIGSQICRRLLQRPEAVAVIAAADVDPRKAGRPLSIVTGDSSAPSITVDERCIKAPSSGGVAIHATSSSFSSAAPQVMALLELGWNVLSTCEEMSHPWSADGALAKTVSEMAHHRHLTVLAAGINPGFMMDALPLILSTVCLRIDSIRVRRVVDTNHRRVPLQLKAGVGKSPEEFAALAATGSVGHVGLSQSIHLLAQGLGWTLGHINVSMAPVLASAEIETPIGRVPAGCVAGQRQIASSSGGNNREIRLELEMVAGADAIDEIWIEGDPSLHQTIEGGVNGDVGTEGVIANLVPAVYVARPGLLTIVDLLPPARKR